MLKEDNIGENIHDLGYDNDFLDKTSKAWCVREITNKQNFMKIKNLCPVKDNIKRKRR